LWIQVGSVARIVRLGPADLDLTRLVTVLRYVDRIVSRPSSPTEAREGLRRQLRRPVYWPDGVHRLAFVTTSAAAAVLLGGGAQDVVFSAVAGAITLGVLSLVQGHKEWRPLQNVSVAFVLGVFGALCGVLGGSPAVIGLSGAILFLPGLSLTTALAEVSEGHWSTGSARLLGVAMVLAEFAAGVSLGWWAMGQLPNLMDPVGLPAKVLHTVPILAPATFAVLLKVRPADLPVVWLTAILGWVVASTVGGLAGAALGGLMVGAVAAPLGRFTRVPDLVLVLPGILQLVPGSLGVRGVEQLLSRNFDNGLDLGLLALETAGAIAAGVLAGQALTRPIRAAEEPRHPIQSMR
jgi:uncharacterized membrane protein YjjB (DUF3815 family)